ncbi:hypothetical protein IF1G_04106 [Cordyceps javanica]|uniref:Uncharacterized protein n=1 Tax=Cordyceps javanica TaxID=43265 RepID=A0A545V584_9HYPO|nr:hypothetical protein IF1G_04106 [Cordyceps javanica]
MSGNTAMSVSPCTLSGRAAGFAKHLSMVVSHSKLHHPPRQRPRPRPFCETLFCAQLEQQQQQLELVFEQKKHYCDCRSIFVSPGWTERAQQSSPFLPILPVRHMRLDKFLAIDLSKFALSATTSFTVKQELKLVKWRLVSAEFVAGRSNTLKSQRPNVCVYLCVCSVAPRRVKPCRVDDSVESIIVLAPSLCHTSNTLISNVSCWQDVAAEGLRGPSQPGIIPVTVYALA